jgi:hypothetical protein
MTAEKVRAGIAVALKQFTDRGWESDVGFIRPDETAGPTVERQLCSTNYDCVVIGGGVRLPPRNLALLEVVINAVRKAAPGAAIAFNTRPDDSAALPPDGWRLEAELYSPASNKASSPPQARPVNDSPGVMKRVQAELLVAGDSTNDCEHGCSCSDSNTSGKVL